MLTTGSKVAIVIVLVLSLCGYVSYKQYQAVEAERVSVANKQLEANAALQSKYNKLSKEYNTLRAKKDIVRTKIVEKEERLINENKDYYSAACFDAVSLHHIQQAQSGTIE